MLQGSFSRCRRTVVMRAADLCAGTLQLIDCHACYVYALAPARCVELLGCTNCTVVCSSVACALTVAREDPTAEPAAAPLDALAVPTTPTNKPPLPSVSLQVAHCERLRLHAVCKTLRLSNCHEATLHLCVNSLPLLWGENKRVAFAPFCAVYAHLAAHVRPARLHFHDARRLAPRPDRCDR